MAQEWKTFLPENREATTGRGSGERPWVTMHPFGEVTHLEMQRRPPEPMRPRLFGNGDNIKSPYRVCLQINTTQCASMKKVECVSICAVKLNMGVVDFHQDS